MSYENLLTDDCDIYHLKTRTVGGGGFGIPEQDRQEEFYYDDIPDVAGQRCYFTEREQSIVQAEPNNTIIQSYSVHFPVSADIRTNSKVIWDGITLKAQKPRNIRGHHQEVVLIRRDNL